MTKFSPHSPAFLFLLSKYHLFSFIAKKCLPKSFLNCTYLILTSFWEKIVIIFYLLWRSNYEIHQKCFFSAFDFERFQFTFFVLLIIMGFSIFVIFLPAQTHDISPTALCLIFLTEKMLVANFKSVPDFLTS
jgi:hypothetical protein